MWPRGHIFKSLALASNPQVLENCLVLGSRIALFFEWLKFCRSAEKCFSRPFFFGDRRKKIFKTFFLRKTLAFVSLVLGLGFFCVLGLGLEPCVPDSTSVILCLHYLVTSFEIQHYFENIYYYVICSLVLQVLDSLYMYKRAQVR